MTLTTEDHKKERSSRRRQYWRDVSVQFVGTILAGAFLYFWAIILGYLKQPDGKYTAALAVFIAPFALNGLVMLSRFGEPIPRLWKILVFIIADIVLIYLAIQLAERIYPRVFVRFSDLE